MVYAISSYKGFLVHKLILKDLICIFFYTNMKGLKNVFFVFFFRPPEATTGRVRSQAAKSQGRENKEEGGANPGASPWLLCGNWGGADIPGLALRMCRR